MLAGAFSAAWAGVVVCVDVKPSTWEASVAELYVTWEPDGNTPGGGGMLGLVNEAVVSGCARAGVLLDMFADAKASSTLEKEFPLWSTEKQQIKYRE